MGANALRDRGDGPAPLGGTAPNGSPGGTDVAAPARRGRFRVRLSAQLSARSSDRLREDRGSGAAAVLIFALVFMALAAFVVDGGLSIAKRERAADIAEQAARYAAQDIDVDQLRNAAPGTQPQIVYQDCTARVQQFAASVKLSAQDRRNSYCTFADADRVEVRVQITYEPILSGFYRNHVTVVGTAAAVSITGGGN